MLWTEKGIVMASSSTVSALRARAMQRSSHQAHRPNSSTPSGSPSHSNASNTTLCA